MKKNLGIMIALALVAIMTIGCGQGANSVEPAESTDVSAEVSTEESADVSSGDKKTIGVTVYYMTEFVTLMTDGIEAEAAEQGADVIVLDAGNDAQNQISQIENLIAQDVDAIVVAAVDADAIVPAVQMCEDAGIPLVGLNMLINTDDPYYYIGPNDVEAGELEMQYIVDQIGEEGNIVILEGPIGTSAQLERMEGNQNILDKYPNIQVLAHQPANWNREEALALTENWLQAFEGQIDGIVAHNDEMALGAIQALEAENLTIPVAGVDAIKDACQAIKADRLDATVFQDAELEGRLGVRMAMDILAGNHPAEHLNYIEMKLITKDNVDELLDTIYK